MKTNQRVRIDSLLLFDGFDPTTKNINHLAAVAAVSTKLIYDMLRAAQLPDRGFFSNGVMRLCEARGKPIEFVILGVFPRRGRTTDSTVQTTNAPQPPGVLFMATVPVAKKVEIEVPANRSPLEQPEAAELIDLQPGEALEFASFDPIKTWAYDPAACVEQSLVEHTFVYPDSAEPSYFTALQLSEARDGLMKMLHSVIVRFICSFGVRSLSQIARRSVPLKYLLESTELELKRLGRSLPAEWLAMPEYVVQLQERLQKTRRPINIQLSSAKRHPSAIAFWRSACAAPILQRRDTGDRDAWKALGPWTGPAGESTRPAGNGFPLPDAPAGACIGHCGFFDEEGAFVITSTHRFSTPGDRIANNSPSTRACRLTCNDPQPGDNLGSVKITLNIHAKPQEPPS